MLSLRKKPRAMRPGQILPKWFSLQCSERLVDETEVAKAQELSDDPVQFFRQVVGFEPTVYQKEFTKLFLENQFLAARWCRQSGKSWIVSALLLWYAVTHPDSYIGVVCPSWRQAKLIIRRIAYFVKNLPPGMAFKPLKTVIRFTNGAVIEAFPCNPDTIRGPTLDLVYADEFSFMPDDEEIYDAILFTISTKSEGKFVCTSTPWSTDSLFYKIFYHKGYEDFAKHHVTWQQAVKPNGPLKRTLLEKIRKQFAEDPWRWKREMEAEWAEDESCYFSQDLITQCIDGGLQYATFEGQLSGRFCIGVDLGKKRDYSVVAVVELLDKGQIRLVHLCRFKLGTPYASVIGYIKALTDRYRTVETIFVDQTGVGEYVVEDMGTIVANTKGVILTAQRKEEVLSHMRELMQTRKLALPYDSQLIAEIHCEKFELTKEGHMKFSHPEGTHDDRLWALALACLSTREAEAPSKLVRAW